MTWGEFWWVWSIPLLYTGGAVVLFALVGLAVVYQLFCRQDSKGWRDDGEGE